MPKAPPCTPDKTTGKSRFTLQKLPVHYRFPHHPHTGSHSLPDPYLLIRYRNAQHCLRNRGPGKSTPRRAPLAFPHVNPSSNAHETHPGPPRFTSPSPLHRTGGVAVACVYAAFHMLCMLGCLGHTACAVPGSLQQAYQTAECFAQKTTIALSCALQCWRCCCDICLCCLFYALHAVSRHMFSKCLAVTISL